MKLLYWITYPIMMITLKIFFRRVYFPHLKNLPTDKAAIVVTNHHNSFLDGIILTVLMKQRLYILARGDVFKGKFKKWLLGQFYLLPIFRKSEAKNNLEKNQATFEIVHEKLKHKHAVLIFPEGVSIQEKRLQKPLKKGVVRMAFGSAFEQKEKVDLRIIPMGINFTRPQKLRGEVIIQAAEAIEIEDYRKDFEENPSQAGNKLLKTIEERIESCLVRVLDPKNDAIAEAALSWSRAKRKHFGWWFSKSSSAFESERTLCESINAGDFEKKRKPLGQLLKLSQEYGLRPVSFQNKYFGLRGLFVLLFFPLHLAGLLYRMGLGKRALKMTQKKVRLKEFFGSVYLSLGMILFLIQSLILMLIFGLIAGKTGLLIWLVWALCGWFSVYFEEAVDRWIQNWRLKQCPEKIQMELHDLYAQVFGK